MGLYSSHQQGNEARQQMETIMNIRKPTSIDAAEVRTTAAMLGYKVRVKVCKFSLRVCGDRDQVKTVLSVVGLVNASGEQFSEQTGFRSWNQEHEVFAYVAA